MANTIRPLKETETMALVRDSRRLTKELGRDHYIVQTILAELKLRRKDMI